MLLRLTGIIPPDNTPFTPGSQDLDEQVRDQTAALRQAGGLQAVLA